MKRLSIVMILLLIGCTESINKREADIFLSEYYEVYKQKDYDRIANLYSAEFYAKISRDKWINILKDVRAELGDVKSYEQISCGATSYLNIGNKKGGIYYSYLYSVQYANKSVEEMVNLFKAKGSQKYEVTGYKILGNFWSQRSYK